MYIKLALNSRNDLKDLFRQFPYLDSYMIQLHSVTSTSYFIYKSHFLYFPVSPSFFYQPTRKRPLSMPISQYPNIFQLSLFSLHPYLYHHIDLSPSTTSTFSTLQPVQLFTLNNQQWHNPHPDQTMARVDTQIRSQTPQHWDSSSLPSASVIVLLPTPMNTTTTTEMTISLKPELETRRVMMMQQIGTGNATSVPTPTPSPLWIEILPSSPSRSPTHAATQPCHPKNPPTVSPLPCPRSGAGKRACASLCSLPRARPRVRTRSP
jgi:hypothetical protein